MKIKRLICAILSLVVLVILFTSCDSLFLKETRYPEVDIIYPQSKCWIKTTSFDGYETGTKATKDNYFMFIDGIDELPITIENLSEVIGGEVVYRDTQDASQKIEAESLMDLYENYAEDIIVYSSGHIRVDQGAFEDFNLVFVNDKYQEPTLKELMDNGEWYIENSVYHIFDNNYDEINEYAWDEVLGAKDGESYAMMDNLKEMLGKPDVVTTPVNEMINEETGESTYTPEYYYYTMYFNYEDYALKITILDTEIDTNYREGNIINIKYMASGAIENPTRFGDYYRTDEYNSEFYEGRENVYDWGEELDNGIFVNYEIEDNGSMFY